MIKNRLKDKRHDLRMNQKEFAAYIDVDDKLYNRWERQKGQPSLLMALRISARLECSVNDLFDFE